MDRRETRKRIRGVSEKEKINSCWKEKNGSSMECRRSRIRNMRKRRRRRRRRRRWRIKRQ